jgi:pimeloyl-ACP methyl ester carboxylesterase
VDLQFFSASDGAQIAYADQGQGRPLLLLHGLMAHSGFFERQQELARDFRVICVDLRGHGQSRGGGQTPTVEILARDVAELVEMLDLHDAIGLGWSLGAHVLWHVLTGTASSRFAGAVVVDMTPRVLNDQEWQLGLSSEVCEDRAGAIAADFPSFAAAAGQAIFAQPVAEQMRAAADWSAKEFARNDSAMIGALWQSLTAQDFRTALGGIRQPTLIVHGAQSHLYGSDTADHLAAALPNATAIQFSRSGHSPHIEEPELFNQSLRDFAATLPRVRDTEMTA